MFSKLHLNEYFCSVCKLDGSEACGSESCGSMVERFLNSLLCASCIILEHCNLCEASEKYAFGILDKNSFFVHMCVCGGGLVKSKREA